MQLEPPAVQGADNFSLLDPALAQGATGMRAAVRQGDNRLSDPEDRQAQTKNLAGSTPPRGNLIEAANGNPLGHATFQPFDFIGLTAVTRNCISHLSLDLSPARYDLTVDTKSGTREMGTT
jgi:hypothetical protein